MSKKDKEKAATAIAAGRVAIGAGAYVAPNLSGRLFGLDPDGNPQASYLGRLFGARDVALGAGVLRSPRKQKDAWVAAGMACDVADVGAGALAGIRGHAAARRGRDGHRDGRVLRADERVPASAITGLWAAPDFRWHTPSGAKAAFTSPGYPRSVPRRVHATVTDDAPPPRLRRSAPRARPRSRPARR